VDVEQQLGSRYLLHEMIGRGAMGQVFAGTVRDSGDRVAVKVLRPELVSDPEAVARFMQERQILTSINNPAIVRVIDLVVEGETLAIVMELISGQDLRRYLRANCTLPPAEAVALAVQLLRGLAAIHAAGVMHRDIKPENLLLDSSAGQAVVKVTDFGVARLTYGASLTKLSTLIGTPDYMAPELAERGGAAPPADLYSAGVVLYEMLSGRTPFADDSLMTVLRRHADMAPPPIPGVPADLWTEISRLLAKDPAVRPASAADAAEALASQAAALATLPALPPMAAPDAYHRASSTPAPGLPDGYAATVMRARERDGLPNLMGLSALVDLSGPARPTGPVPAISAAVPAWPKRNRLLLAFIAATAVAVAAGSLIALIPSWLHRGTSVGSTVGYSFPAQQYPDGLRLARQWTLSGPGGSVFTEIVTASAAGTAVQARFDEAIPPAVVGSLGTAQFSPPIATIVPAGHAVEWQVSVPARGSVTVSYRATVAADGTAEARLASWAGDLAIAQAALPAPQLIGSTPTSSPAPPTPSPTLPPTPAPLPTLSPPVTLAPAPTITTTTVPATSPAQVNPPPVVSPYVSVSLASDSSSVTARAYFGELSSIVEALSGQVTFSTSADLMANQPGVCVETVVFSQVASPTGVVGAEDLGKGWTAAESIPSPGTEGGNLHQQLVVPPSTVSPGDSWQVSAVLIAPSLRLNSDAFSLQFQGQAGSTQTWLVNGATVTCEAGA
jgi:Protein kinase domain